MAESTRAQSRENIRPDQSMDVGLGMIGIEIY